MLAICCCFLLSTPPKAFSQTDDEEYRVKLAFLYNFAQYVQWPAEAFPSAAMPFAICVVGDDPFAGEIEQGLRGRTARGHPIQIRKLKAADDPRACHIIFIRAHEKRSAEKVLAAAKGSSALTVGESQALAQGVIINLALADNKLRFEINLDAATQNGLKISSKLLALAKIVRGEQTPRVIDP